MADKPPDQNRRYRAGADRQTGHAGSGLWATERRLRPVTASSPARDPVRATPPTRPTAIRISHRRRGHPPEQPHQRHRDHQQRGRHVGALQKTSDPEIAPCPIASSPTPATTSSAAAIRIVAPITAARGPALRAATHRHHATSHPVTTSFAANGDIPTTVADTAPHPTIANRAHSTDASDMPPPPTSKPPEQQGQEHADHQPLPGEERPPEHRGNGHRDRAPDRYAPQRSSPMPSSCNWRKSCYQALRIHGFSGWVRSAVHASATAEGA